MKTIFLICLIFSIVGCKNIHPSFEDQELAAAAEESCGFVQNSMGQRVSWNQQLPVKFFFHQDFPQQFRPPTIAAIKNWNLRAGRELVRIEGTDQNVKWSLDGKNIIYWIETADVFSNQFQQGKSLLRWTGTQMTDVDILINAFDWKFSSETVAQAGLIDFESLIVHEIGHALGLAHQTNKMSVMYTSLSSGTIRNVPLLSPDQEALKCEYQ